MNWGPRVALEPWRLIPTNGVIRGEPRRRWHGTDYRLRDPWRPRQFWAFRIWRVVFYWLNPPWVWRGGAGMTGDVRVYGGPRDGADLTYKQVAFAFARGELAGYYLDERRTAGTNEEYLCLIHRTWVRKQRPIADGGRG